MSAVRQDLDHLDYETVATEEMVADERAELRGSFVELAPVEDAAVREEPMPARRELQTLTLHPIEATGGDWAQTLTMVERAAATIRAYEKRFLQLEKQGRALADRAAEDHHRLQSQLRVLEDRAKLAEERAAAAETTLRDAEYAEWEAEMRAKRAEERAHEAEARALQAETYLRRVHELLANV